MRKYRFKPGEREKLAHIPSQKVVPRLPKAQPAALPMETEMPPLEKPAEPLAEAEGSALPPVQYRKMDDTKKAFSVRSLVEVAMMVAITVLLAFLNYVVPIVGLLGPLVLPLPFAILVLRRGVKLGIFAAVCSAILIALLLNPLASLLLMVEYGLLGLFLGLSFRKRYKPMTTLIVGTVIVAVGTMLNLVLSTYVAGLPMSDITAQLDEMVIIFCESMFANAGDNLSQLLPAGMTAAEYQQAMIDSMHTLLPGVLIAVSMFLASVCYIVTTKVLRRLRYDVLELPPFREWRLNWKMVWGVIIALLLVFIGNQSGIALLSQIAYNILYMYYFILLVFGLSFLVWFLKTWKADKMIKGLIVLLILFFGLNNFGLFIIMGIALFDPLLDLRGRLAKSIS